MSTYKGIRRILTILYMAFILWVTIFSRNVCANHIFKGLFWEVRNRYWNDIILNILFFVPLGILIGGKKGVAIGAILTFVVEMTQYIFKLGYCEVDDVMNNVIGTIIGVKLSKCFFRKVLLLCIKLKKLVYLIFLGR